MSRLNLDESGQEKMKIFVNGRENEGSTIWRKRLNVKGHHNAKVKFDNYTLIASGLPRRQQMSRMFHKTDLLPLGKPFKIKKITQRSVRSRVFKIVM